MTYTPGRKAVLRDRKRRDLGRVIVDRIDGTLVVGPFISGPEYDQVATLFAEYIDAANEGVLSVVGELDSVIADLGLTLETPEGLELPAICDVQIGAGTINFRVRPNGECGVGEVLSGSRLYTDGLQEASP
jgi:hypothetical protein